MALTQELETTGNWLFRWRSYLPIALLIPLLVEMRHFDWPMHDHGLQFVWEMVCLAVSATGLAIRAFTVGHVSEGTSGRNRTRQIAEKLNVTSIYSLVRHPLYVGNFLMWLGIAMFCLDWRLMTIFLLAFFLYYERIMFAEEAFLRRKFGEEFESWAAKTPLFFPNFRNWQRATSPFSWKMVLRREYCGLLGMLAAFFALDTISDSVVEDRLVIEPFWMVAAIVGLTMYIFLRTIRKHTSLLA